MRPLTLAFLVAAAPGSLAADGWIASRTLPANTIVAETDLTLKGGKGDGSGKAAGLDEIVGLEVRATIYAGRPVRPELLQPPAIIERNDVVKLNYHRAGLAITTEGRALGRAAVGERLRVLNLGSRTTVMGVARIDRSVSVAPD